MYTEYHSLARLIQMLDLGDYLEFGCGNGTFLKYVLDLNQSYQTLTAVDINARAVEEAKSKLAAYDVNYIVQEHLPLDLDDHQFTTITLSNTLHHLRDKTAILAELKRLIKPDGRIIITEMFCDNLTEAEQTYCRFHALRAETDRLKGSYHDTTYTLAEIVNLVTEAGLKIASQKILLNEKRVVIDQEEISRMETIIDDLVQGEIERPNFKVLKNKAESIKENLRQHGIKRPRQLYLETI